MQRANELRVGDVVLVTVAVDQTFEVVGEVGGLVVGWHVNQPWRGPCGGMYERIWFQSFRHSGQRSSIGLSWMQRAWKNRLRQRVITSGAGG